MLNRPRIYIKRGEIEGQCCVGTNDTTFPSDAGCEIPGQRYFSVGSIAVDYARLEPFPTNGSPA